MSALLGQLCVQLTQGVVDEVGKMIGEHVTRDSDVTEVLRRPPLIPQAAESAISGGQIKTVVTLASATENADDCQRHLWRTNQNSSYSRVHH